MRQRLHQGGVHRQRGIEQVREADAQRLRHQPEQRAVAVEAPRAALRGALQARFVFPVEELAAQLAARAAVGQLQRLRSDPARAHHRDRGLGQDAAHAGAGLQILQLHGCDDSRTPPRARRRLRRI